MIVAFFAALALGQCPGGFCPAPTAYAAAPTWTVSTPYTVAPAYAPQPVSGPAFGGPARRGLLARIFRPRRCR